jgi:hypothetical protein
MPPNQELQNVTEKRTTHQGPNPESLRHWDATDIDVMRRHFDRNCRRNRRRNCQQQQRRGTPDLTSLPEKRYIIGGTEDTGQIRIGQRSGSTPPVRMVPVQMLISHPPLSLLLFPAALSVWRSAVSQD